MGRVVVRGAVVVAIASLAVGLVLQGWTDVSRLEESLFVVSGSLYALVGAVVLRTNPRHAIGWLLLGIGVLVTTGFLAEQVVVAHYVAGHDIPGALLSLWYVQWYWLPFVYAQFVFVPMLFPTGRWVSDAWRRFGRVLLAVAALVTVAAMFGQQLMIDMDYLAEVLVVPSPVGLLPFDDIESGAIALAPIVPLQVGAIAALASLVARFRRSRGAERQQMKWGVFGVAVTLGSFVLWVVVDAVLGFRMPVADGITNAVAPLAMGIAITRYRLWDLDRLVSRTVSYAVLTVLLTGVYAGVVLGAQAVAGREDASDLAVAAATLAATALVRPLRGRVQARVDRRFNRAGYDAEGVAEAFGARLRDSVDAGALSADLRVTAARVLHPSSATVWLARRDAS